MVTRTISKFCARCQIDQRFSDERCITCNSTVDESNHHNVQGLFLFVNQHGDEWERESIPTNLQYVREYSKWLVWQEWTHKQCPPYWYTHGMFEQFVIVYGKDEFDLEDNYKLFQESIK